MGVSHYFSRVKKSNDYIINESKIYPFVEVDYSKMKKNIIDHVEMRHTMSFKLVMDHKTEFELYHTVDFSFYFNAVNSEYGVSYKQVDGVTCTVLFYPEHILNVVNKILPRISSLKHDIHDTEIKDLFRLKEFLDEGATHGDLIFSEIVW